MESVVWGLLGPEGKFNERRARTLGLGAAVRRFNDLAVPGLGGVWFGKQLLLASLGIAVASKARAMGMQKNASNIEVTNAIEALACWLALSGRRWAGEARLRGATKMRGKTDLSYAAACKSNFYVTQPMRQATGQPLLALGLAQGDSERFNALACSPRGQEFLAVALGPFNPYKLSVENALVEWVRGTRTEVSSSTMADALSPLAPLAPDAARMLHGIMVTGTCQESTRRRAVLAWMLNVGMQPGQRMNWNSAPRELDDAHWRDLRIGALFFATRDAAIALLEKVEAHMGSLRDRSLSLARPLPDGLKMPILELQRHAQAFLHEDHDPTPGKLATAFCEECASGDPALLLEKLVERDGRVLMLRSRMVTPGGAFAGNPLEQASEARSSEEAGNETPTGRSVAWPASISHRIPNAFLFNLDLQGKLDSWLQPAAEDKGSPV